MSGINQITRLVDNIQNAGQYDPETGFYEMRRSLVDVRDITNRIVSEQLIPADKQDNIRIRLHLRQLPYRVHRIMRTGTFNFQI